MTLDPTDEEQLDPASTGRMPRRLSVMAQIEAALLAQRLTIESPLESSGTDPYNQGSAQREPWRSRR